MLRGDDYLNEKFDKDKIDNLEYVNKFYNKHNGRSFTLADYNHFIMSSKGWEIWDQFWELQRERIRKRVKDGSIFR